MTSDVILFDQRGCLSPRIVLVLGSEMDGRRVAEHLTAALEEAERRVPLGRLSNEELADAVRYRDTIRFGAELFRAGSSWVGLDVRGERLVVPPAGRHVHVVVVKDLPVLAAPLRGLVAALGAHGPPHFMARARRLFPRVRISAPGRMQRPPFDGPVDRRTRHGS